MSWGLQKATSFAIFEGEIVLEKYDAFVMDDPVAALRHNLLGELTVIKNALSFVLEGRTGKISQETKKFLEEAYKRNEKLIETLVATRKEQ